MAQSLQRIIRKEYDVNRHSTAKRGSICPLILETLSAAFEIGQNHTRIHYYINQCTN